MQCSNTPMGLFLSAKGSPPLLLFSDMSSWCRGRSRNLMTAAKGVLAGVVSLLVSHKCSWFDGLCIPDFLKSKIKK